MQLRDRSHRVLRHGLGVRSDEDRGEQGEAPKLDALVHDARRGALRLARTSPGVVLNATGVVLHTNLGRAPLAPEAAAAAAEAAAHYTDLELDLGDGRRGDRSASVRELLRILSGAESALVVNNNAAAMLLIAGTFAEVGAPVTMRLYVPYALSAGDCTAYCRRRLIENPDMVTYGLLNLVGGGR